jgi:transcription antitermination factor NusG
MSRLTAYRVPPQMEFKAARELRENGHRAYVPRDLADKRRPPIARGYVFSGGKHAFARHVRSPVGPVPTDQLARLYQLRHSVQEVPVALKAGDRVEIKVGPFASVTGTLARLHGRRRWMVDLGTRVVSARVDTLIRIDPG